MGDLRPAALDRPALLDTTVWTWARDRRFPELAAWFNDEVVADHVLVCDLVVLELVRLAPNERRAREVAKRLSAFDCVPMAASAWSWARSTQLALAANGAHRSVPPSDLLIAAAATEANVMLVHHDADYEAIGAVTSLQQRWLACGGIASARDESGSGGVPLR